jgi:hypothetical protein
MKCPVCGAANATKTVSEFLGLIWWECSSGQCAVWSTSTDDKHVVEQLAKFLENNNGESGVQIDCNQVVIIATSLRDTINLASMAEESNLNCVDAQFKNTTLNAENASLKIALVEAAIPLEAMMLSGQGAMSDELWQGVQEAVGKIRTALENK